MRENHVSIIPTPDEMLTRHLNAKVSEVESLRDTILAQLQTTLSAQAELKPPSLSRECFIANAPCCAGIPRSTSVGRMRSTTRRHTAR